MMDDKTGAGQGKGRLALREVRAESTASHMLCRRGRARVRPPRAWSGTPSLGTRGITRGRDEAGNSSAAHMCRVFFVNV
ncbi:hypothetical protein VZT92_010641 [Zoarces viviparus]|uniref:Uncharacterized protein n=1 Tax=Zoarces viviparus TaxID=48416 RepID=A0AAW1F8Y4_ZOAVI